MSRFLRTWGTLGAAILLAGCAQTHKPLYMWEAFPRHQYDALLHEGASPDSQIQAMEQQAVKAQGANAALPPGFRAHLGMLYLGNGNADKARQLWTNEMETFPESMPYMQQLLKRLNGDATPVASEKGPA